MTCVIVALAWLAVLAGPAEKRGELHRRAGVLLGIKLRQANGWRQSRQW